MINDKTHYPYPYLFCVIAITIWGSAKLGLLLIVPPWYASPLWPPAGIGLALILTYGYRVAPAMLLALFVANIESGLSINPPLSLASLLTAFCIASGSTLQACIANALIIKITHKKILATKETEILIFLALAGPLACIISPTVGVSTLYINGTINNTINNNDIINNWLAWWAGDSVGVLITTPLTLILLGATELVSKNRIKHVFLPISAILIIFITFYIMTWRNDQQNLKNQFNAKAETLAQLTESSITSSISSAHAFQAFLNTQDNINFKKMESYAQQITKHTDIIQALEWIPHVRLQERYEFEQRLINLGYKEFTFTEKNGQQNIITAKQRQEYYPVYFIYPLKQNLAAFGYDLFSNKQRKSAINLSLRSGKTVASEGVSLIQDKGNQFGFLLFMPLQRSSSPVNGFALAVLRIGDIINNSLKGHNYPGINIQLIDNTKGATNRHLYGKLITQSQLSYSYPIELKGRQWSLQFDATTEYIKQQQSWHLWAALTTAFVFTSFFTIFLIALNNRNDIVNLMVNTQTQQLTNTNIKLKEANKVKNDFLTNMSHELRTPLNSIIGFSKRLLKRYDGKIDSKAIEAIQTIHRNGFHLLNLINSILDLSKIESGKMTIEYESVDIQELLNTAHELIISLAVEQNLELTIYNNSTLKNITGDFTKLLQILINLMSNAIKYTPTGKVSLTVETTRNYAGIEGITFICTDTGIGIPEQDLPNIFKEFTQSENRLSLKQQGSGLGLALVHQFTELHHGTISVSSKLNQGSTFTVWIPDQSAVANANE